VALKNKIKNSIITIASVIAIQLSRFVKFNYIVGSYAAFFSATNIITPMSGVLTGNKGALRIFTGNIVFKFIIFGTKTLGSLTFGIPSLFASIYWNSKSKAFKLLVPICCMALFALNPIGAKAFAYCMLWLIPVAITLSNNSTVFLTALSSTFIAHAIGSLIWLYTLPMPAQAWLNLIPVALVERVMFALGMTAIYYAYNMISKTLKEPKAKFSLTKLLQKI